MAGHSSGAVALLLILSGCSRISGPRNLPVDSVRSGLAMDALNRFSEALNRGACETIYGQASEIFRGLESPAEWRGECARMRTNLGAWGSFHVHAVVATGPTTVLVDGTVVFANGPCHLRTTWNLENGQARLFALYLLEPSGPISIPSPRPRSKPRLADPPPSLPAVAA